MRREEVHQEDIFSQQTYAEGKGGLPPDKQKSRKVTSGFRAISLERDRFAGAFADASTAFNAVCFFDFSLTIDHFDGSDGASTHASFATAASIFINFSCHFSFS
jgi:hypothetical protein